MSDMSQVPEGQQSAVCCEPSKADQMLNYGKTQWTCNPTIVRQVRVCENKVCGCAARGQNPLGCLALGAWNVLTGLQEMGQVWQ